ARADRPERGVLRAPAARHAPRAATHVASQDGHGGPDVTTTRSGSAPAQRSARKTSAAPVDGVPVLGGPVLGAPGGAPRDATVDGSGTSLGLTFAETMAGPFAMGLADPEDAAR